MVRQHYLKGYGALSTEQVAQVIAKKRVEKSMRNRFKRHLEKIAWESDLYDFAINTILMRKRVRR